MKSNLDVRPSPFVGEWYPADPLTLAQSVDRYLAGSDSPALDGQVIGLIVPHAGHRYSGPVAAYAFNAIRDLTPELVVIVSPKHRPHPARLVTTAYAAYGTPLGRVEVDQDALTEVNAALSSALGEEPAALERDQEHAVEIELPFLQRALKQPFKVLPVMMRDQSPATAQALAEAIAGVARGKPTLLVASTDLSHGETQSGAQVLDHNIVEQIGAFSPQGVYQVEARGKGYACGLGAVTSVLYAARALGADRVQVLNYATSGDVSGDFSYVVGYVAAAILKTT